MVIAHFNYRRRDNKLLKKNGIRLLDKYRAVKGDNRNLLWGLQRGRQNWENKVIILIKYSV